MGKRMKLLNFISIHMFSSTPTLLSLSQLFKVRWAESILLTTNIIMESIIDAHCHPTDTPQELHLVANLSVGKLIVMGTRPTDQKYVEQLAKEYPGKVIPSFGIHPWFSYYLYDDLDKDLQSSETRKKKHYEKILTPIPDEDFINALPNPVPISEFLEDARRHLKQYPNALIGEIGLDKPFRLPVGPYDARSSLPQGPLSPFYVKMEHQCKVFEAQVRLAAEFQRAVSVHCVQTYALLYSSLAKFWDGRWIPSKTKIRKMKKEEYENSLAEERKHYPPKICLHSYSGSIEQISQFSAHKVPTEFYYSFSIGINSRYKNFLQTLKGVPDDKLLAESDHHSASQIDELVRQSLNVMSEAKSWTFEDTITKISSNSKAFLKVT